MYSIIEDFNFILYHKGIESKNSTKLIHKNNQERSLIYIIHGQLNLKITNASQIITSKSIAIFILGVKFLSHAGTTVFVSNNHNAQSVFVRHMHLFPF